MKLRRSVVIGFLFLLAACSGKPVLSYSLSLRTPNAAKAMVLIQATERVLTRRLAALEVKNARVSAIPTGSGTGLLSLRLPDAKAAEDARRILAETFTFDIRIEQGQKSKGDPGNLDQSNWQPTALTGSSIEWIQAIGLSSSGEIGVELQFNAKGRQILETIFRDNQGKDAGIFVRDLLVSKIKIQGKTVSDRVIIGGIPSAKVAEIFADDVNVGLHVFYTPAN